MSFFLKNKRKNRKASPVKFLTGFTLIEIMVSVSIFVIVAFIVTSTLLVIMDANQRANQWRSIMDTVNFAVDSMSYKLKFGGDYIVTPNYLGTKNDQISFVDRELQPTKYCVGSTPDGHQAIYKCSFSKWTPIQSTECIPPVPGNTNCSPITSSEINVISLNILCDGYAPCPTLPSDGLQTNRNITLLVRAEATLKGQKQILDFQTSVSQVQSSGL